MVENIDNNIDNIHKIKKSETPDKDFDEEKNQKEIQLLRQENKEAKRKQEENAKMLFQQNFDNASPINENIKPQQIEEESQGDNKKEIKHVEEMVLKNDIKGILQYLGLDKKVMNKGEQIQTRDFMDKDLLDELDFINPPKDILKYILEGKDDFKFLTEKNEIINETQNEYNKLYNKLIEIKEGKDDGLGNIFINLVKKVFKGLKRLKNNNKIFGYLYKNLMCKKITKNIIELKHVLKAKRKDITKRLKRYHEYEKGEYINFPNGISFELGKGPETINGTNINIGENEFYIKTHIEKNGEYIEYVESLKKARKLFGKKGIKIKYCKRCTRLANREFIEAYEKERQKRKEKEGANYEKSNRLKVLEQTASAVVSYKLEKDGKSAMRFIDKNKDKNLFEFANKQNNNFGEAEMWLDLDLL